MLKPKMRIQLLDNEQRTISDRLVDQYTEFYQGPKNKHEGPIKVELHLDNTESLDKAINYLNQLKGDLPIKVTAGRGRPSGSTSPMMIDKPGANEMTMDQREELMNEALKKGTDQDKLIAFLREHNFRFMMQDFVDALKLDFGCKKVHNDKYQWMMRLIKEAKDPANDKYDPLLVFGIKMVPERSPKVVVYFFKEFKKKYDIEVPKKADFNFKTTSLSKFPKYMTYEEREKWRREHRILMNNPETHKKSKFYLRWEKDIELGDTLKISAQE